ncbi:MAG: DinB family protein [Gemmatimonas sp.]
MEFNLEDGIAVLERTPATLRAMLSGHASQWMDATEGPETWSPYVIVGHLIHGERDDWVTRAEVILAQGANRTFKPFDRFAQFRESEGKSLETLLNEFEKIRAENLLRVRGWNLQAHHYELMGEHPAFGAVSLRQLLATWVAHDLGHIAQTARVMAKQYRDAVGPWRQYLPVMDR